MSIRLLFVSGIFVSLSSFAQASMAQDISSSNIVDTLKFCQLIQKDTARLKCFDDAISTLTGAVQSKEILVVETSKIEESAQDSFGKRQDGQSPLKELLGLENGHSDQSVTDVVISKVTKTEKTARKRIRFFLENGQVWEQTQQDNVYISKKKQYIAHIKKASISGYKLRLNDKGSLIRVKRIK